ncbi:DUF445 domain-containing protein [Trinickia soli]|uniref:DUF445 domain-containing protein n=1 Tax=Trinickia soli TaxID=380675 RepID=UPI003FA3B8B4
MRLARAEDDAKQLRLSLMRWLATGILIAVAVLYALSVAFEKSSVIWSYVGAFSEAAMVGALADWFAVSALFRHPLGLSFIPHTAIIPKNKDRIADNLGEFVQGEFFSSERITAVIRDVDPAAKLAAWLADERNADAVGAGSTKLLSHGLSLLDHDAVRAFLRKMLARKFVEVDLSTLAGRILQSLTQDGRHQEILNQILAALSSYLNDPEVKRRVMTALADKVPLYLLSLKEPVANLVIEKGVDFLSQLFAEVNHDPKHALRQDFDKAVENLLEKLKSDPAFRAQVKAYQHQIASNEAVTAYVDALWHDFNTWLREDLESRQSVIRSKLTDMIRSIGTALQNDANVRRVINDQILSHVPHLLDHARPKVGHFISSKMKEWKDHEVVHKLELNIGRDLQFIRLNGTFVGGVIGLVIHAVTVAFH